LTAARCSARLSLMGSSTPRALAVAAAVCLVASCGGGSKESTFTIHGMITAGCSTTLRMNPGDPAVVLGPDGARLGAGSVGRALVDRFPCSRLFAIPHVPLGYPRYTVKVAGFRWTFPRSELVDRKVDLAIGTEGIGQAR
jgi:hypothetical protein